MFLIKEKGLSVSRFGDGEINMLISENKGCAFESANPITTKKLRLILNKDLADLLVCIPNLDMGGVWWEEYWVSNFKEFSKYINYSKVYGSAWISRSPVFMSHRETAVELWKKIWADRDVIFITGEGSRFNFQHEIFSGIKSYKVIYSKATNATQDVDRVVDIVKNENKQSLVLISLGVAATILSYDLHMLGFQSIDIGHITNCFDKVFNGDVQPEKLPKTGIIWDK